MMDLNGIAHSHSITRRDRPEPPGAPRKMKGSHSRVIPYSGINTARRVLEFPEVVDLTKEADAFPVPTSELELELARYLYSLRTCI